MYYSKAIFLTTILAFASGCSSSHYSSASTYDYYRMPDTSLFNNGYTDYHNYHGFDVFRGYGSFSNRGFF